MKTVVLIVLLFAAAAAGAAASTVAGGALGRPSRDIPPSVLTYPSTSPTTLIFVGNSSSGSAIIHAAGQAQGKLPAIWVIGNAAAIPDIPPNSAMFVDSYWMSSVGEARREEAMADIVAQTSNAPDLRVIAFGPNAGTLARHLSKMDWATNELQAGGSIYAGFVQGMPTSTMNVAGDPSSVDSLQQGLSDAIAWASRAR